MTNGANVLCVNVDFVTYVLYMRVTSHVVVVVVDPTPPTCCQQSPAPEIMWQGKAPLCRDSSRGPG